MTYCISYHILKKVLCLKELGYVYEIDEDGYGYAIVDDVKIKFYQNSYGEIDLTTVELMD